MKIAVVGCAHGELDKIYEALNHLETENGLKVDLLIICGDFQAVRNPADLQCMAVPPKFRKLNTFYKYYSGTKTAPVLTIFVGGNHEASNYLSELAYGGWVCPNIFYMGYANVINVGGIRIAGLSGIYKGRDYLKGHFETPPYDESSKRSVYHIRNMDVFRLKQIKSHLDIFISHDWPVGVYNYGDKEKLLQRKSFFKDEMDNNQLGSQPAQELLFKLKPSYWFAAHLHCKFAAIVPHEDSEKKTCTKFLALDKCLPRRQYLQILDIESKTESTHLEYDPEWLCILRSTNHLLNTSRRNSFMPGVGSDERWDFTPTEDELNGVMELLNSELKVPLNFATTSEPYNPASPSSPRDNSLKSYINPQTETFCKLLDITDPFSLVCNNSNGNLSIGEFSRTDYSSFLSSSNPDEINISDEDSAEESTPSPIKPVNEPLLQFPEIKEVNVSLDDSKSEEKEVSSSAKVFKRRNWALYKSEEDDSEQTNES
ncbi:uncharacterized protein LOC129219676 [Uloborus diversus]|uniref:uncharacterized protein LOC129219676 n=1 Tax=Uloborus diversus TaxID=327109 RepID=UPI00240920DB|nr:uncharacterized protein LOC129219676 [Uloborus diversus]